MGVSADELLLRPVKVRGIELGTPVDLILAPTNGRRALGFDVLCGDHEHRFLPLAAARLDAGEIQIESTLMLLDGAELEYYRERGSTLASLRGARVSRGGLPAGRLRDILVGRDGAIDALVLESDAGEIVVPYDTGVDLPPSRRTPS